VRRALAAISALFLGGLAQVGCAANGPAGFTVAPGEYARAFDLARDELLRRGFALELVDARGGVILSAPAESGGLATPWSRTEGSLGQEVGSLLHRDRRRVTIRFEPADAAEAGAPLTQIAGSLTAGVAVEREILHRPGLRLSAAGVRLSSTTESAETPRVIARPAGEDPALARRIARRIRRGLSEPPPPDARALEGDHDDG